MSILPKDQKSRQNILLGFRITGDFGASIAVPVVLFVIIGQWLDEKYNTGPWLTIVAFVLAAVVSGRIIYQKAKKYGREYKELNKKI
jgi:F0F1-type ATP synthase assembly protein I